MLSNRRVMEMLFASIAIALLVSRASEAEDADTREVVSYALTESGLARYTQATRNLKPYANQLTDCEGDDDSLSLDASVARLIAVPGVVAAIESAGMSAREYVVFSWSLIHNGMAAWTAGQPGGSLPTGTSESNVDFFRNHETEIQNLAQESSSGDCDKAFEAGDHF